MSSASLPRIAPGPPKKPAPETAASPDRTFAARRWIRRYGARLDRWPIWRLAGAARHKVGYEVELLASDPRHPGRPPPDGRALYLGLHALVDAALAAVATPPSVRVDVRPYGASLVFVPGPPPVFEVPLSVEVVAAPGQGPAACLRHVSALGAHLAALGLKRR